MHRQFDSLGSAVLESIGAALGAPSPRFLVDELKEPQREGDLGNTVLFLLRYFLQPFLDGGGDSEHTDVVRADCAPASLAVSQARLQLRSLVPQSRWREKGIATP